MAKKTAEKKKKEAKKEPIIKYLDSKKIVERLNKINSVVEEIDKELMELRGERNFLITANRAFRAIEDQVGKKRMNEAIENFPDKKIIETYGCTKSELLQSRKTVPENISKLQDRIDSLKNKKEELVNKKKFIKEQIKAFNKPKAA